MIFAVSSLAGKVLAQVADNEAASVLARWYALETNETHIVLFNGNKWETWTPNMARMCDGSNCDSVPAGDCGKHGQENCRSEAQTETLKAELREILDARWERNKDALTSLAER